MECITHTHTHSPRSPLPPPSPQEPTASAAFSSPRRVGVWTRSAAAASPAPERELAEKLGSGQQQRAPRGEGARAATLAKGGGTGASGREWSRGWSGGEIGRGRRGLQREKRGGRSGRPVSQLCGRRRLLPHLALRSRLWRARRGAAGVCV